MQYNQILGRSQVRALGQNSDDVVRTPREFAGSSPKVSGAYRDFARSLQMVLGACREFIGRLPKVIWGLSGVRRELTEGDRGLARNAPGVRQKMTETRWKFTRGCWEDCQEKHFSRIFSGSTTQVGGCTATILFSGYFRR
ncbi:hypothetical protein GW17_00042210 [Ensete ventricosum]|nr:hypothetical protein GW17_00042210 [Ensete ventricosum]